MTSCHVHGIVECSCNAGQRCRTCNQLGHHFSLCPGNIRCAVCHVLGHLAHECNQPGHSNRRFIWKEKTRLPISRAHPVVRFPRKDTHRKIWIEKQIILLVEDVAAPHCTVPLRIPPSVAAHPTTLKDQFSTDGSPLPSAPGFSREPDGWSEYSAVEEAAENFINGVRGDNLNFARAGDASTSVTISMDTEFLLWIGQMMKRIYTRQIMAAPVIPGAPLPINPFAVIKRQLQCFCLAIL